ncbi:CUE domain-containing protein [Chengkuizengella axinellae]|uniref:CUE domain-containing protein n=1 Tax=Chengkuizengella axinellae TaxID=3064388 RepID=A0ABT9J2G5_9BACL|nr:CUE domain-containing protein [Chengkuizengella sp. 2205SS18-9]MDP5275787.1 CUE domain-containing protein [Chengkuizengella sp. 2205SS18-9]
MKKRWILILAVIMVFSIGTTIYANGTDQEENSITNFDEVLSFFKQMHPDWSDEQLEDMYNDCHGDENNMQNFMNW